MTCKNGACADIYSDDREEDYIIEKLTHMEDEIAYIKKILSHKRVKEEAMERLKVEVKNEKKEEEEKIKTKTIDDFIDDIEKELARREKRRRVNTTMKYPRDPYPWSITTWI